MAGFKFRLQTNLNLKRQYEKSAKNELGIAVMKLEKEKEKLRVIENNIELCLDDFRAACRGALDREKIREIKKYLDYLGGEKKRQQANVKKQQQTVDKIREKLVEIMKDRKVLENLENRDLEVFRKEEEKKEQHRVDDLVSYKEAAKMDRIG